MDRKTLLLLAALGIAGFYLYRQFGALKDTLRTAGEAIGSGLFDLFHPDQVGEMLFYKVRFPDGQFHSVPSRAVRPDGTFLNRNLAPNYAGDGKVYRLLIDKRITVGENKTALPV